MSPKKRYFVIVSHCLLNPATRVHLLGKRFELCKNIVNSFLERNISVIQLPCPEFTAMGYMRNPQGRQQYDNVFFKKHCKKELENYVDMIVELKRNNNTPLAYIGVQGSPTCSIFWGKHKINKYKTESMEPDLNSTDKNEIFGVMTSVLDEMLRENGIELIFLEAQVKENINSEKSKKFFHDLEELTYINREE